MEVTARTADADLDFDLTVGQLEADLPEYTAAQISQESVRVPETCQTVYCCC